MGVDNKRKATYRARREELVRAVRRIEARMDSVREAHDREFGEAIERRLHANPPLGEGSSPAPGL